MELPPPDNHEQNPALQAFNPEAMDDVQIRATYRALCDYAEEHDSLEAGSLTDRLGEEVSELAARNPERVLPLVQTWLDSAYGPDLELAVYGAKGLLDHDFSFAVAALCQIEKGNDWRRGTDDEHAELLAGEVIETLRQNDLPVEQRAVFDGIRRAFNII